MNRRNFFKRAIGMGAVVAGIAALPKGAPKAAPTESLADVLRRIATPTPKAEAALSRLGIGHPWIGFGHDTVSGTLVSPTWLPVFEQPSREEQALGARIVIDGQVLADYATKREYDWAHHLATSAGLTSTEAHAMVLRARKAARG